MTSSSSANSPTYSVRNTNATSSPPRTPTHPHWTKPPPRARRDRATSSTWRTWRAAPPVRSSARHPGPGSNGFSAAPPRTRLRAGCPPHRRPAPSHPAPSRDPAPHPAAPLAPSARAATRWTRWRLRERRWRRWARAPTRRTTLTVGSSTTRRSGGCKKPSASDAGCRRPMPSPRRAASPPALADP